MGKISLLIVDDHKLVRESYGLSLKNAAEIGKLAECGDGEEAIRLAGEIRPDIVLLDINMEPMNGFDVVKQIRKFSPSSRIIAVSMHSQVEYAKKMFRLGAKGYITKNSTREEMLRAIQEVMNNGTFICQEVKEAWESKTLTKERKKESPQEETAETTEETAQNIHSLSGRELEVAGQLRLGRSSKEIAGMLHVSVKTVGVHRYNILKKLHLRNTVSLVNYLNSNAIPL